MTVYSLSQKKRRTMKNEIIEIDGKSFELVPVSLPVEGHFNLERVVCEGSYLLKPVEEKKPVKAISYILDERNGKWYGDRDVCMIDRFKVVRPMKREDVLLELMDVAVNGLNNGKSPIDNYLDRLEELGLIQEGES